jgi:hypothetical protein
VQGVAGEGIVQRKRQSGKVAGGVQALKALKLPQLVHLILPLLLLLLLLLPCGC